MGDKITGKVAWTALILALAEFAKAIIEIFC